MRDIAKNTLEVIRVQRTEYRGKALVDVRVWTHKDSTPTGELIPTKKGVSFRRELLPEVVKALRTIVDQERRKGSEVKR